LSPEAGACLLRIGELLEPAVQHGGVGFGMATKAGLVGLGLARRRADQRTGCPQCCRGSEHGTSPQQIRHMYPRLLLDRTSGRPSVAMGVGDRGERGFYLT